MAHVLEHKPQGRLGFSMVAVCLSPLRMEGVRMSRAYACTERCEKPDPSHRIAHGKA